MSRLFAVVLSVLIALPATMQSAEAFEGIFPRHKKVDPRVANTSLGAGVASTVAYWSILDWGSGVHSSADKLAAFGITTLGCMVLSPMVAAAFVPERELTLREVYVLQGSCLIPIVGGMLVNAWFDANPQWDAYGKPVQVVAQPVQVVARKQKPRM